MEVTSIKANLQEVTTDFEGNPIPDPHCDIMVNLECPNYPYRIGFKLPYPISFMQESSTTDLTKHFITHFKAALDKYGLKNNLTFNLSKEHFDIVKQDVYNCIEHYKRENDL